MLTADKIHRAYNELRNEGNDRAAAIVGAALLEGQLEEAITRRLLPMSNAHRDALFRDEYGYTFVSKIELGLSLGLYGTAAKADLHRIRKIRNEFAHNLDRSFASQDVINHCKHLTNYDPIPKETLDQIGPLKGFVESQLWRWRYINAVHHIGCAIFRETLVHYEPPRPTILKD